MTTLKLCLVLAILNTVFQYLKKTEFSSDLNVIHSARLAEFNVWL